MVRFYYTDISVNPANSFSIPTSGTGTTRVLQYVYYPQNNIGYQYDYATPYGMIYQITQYRNMAVTSTSDTSEGTVNTPDPLQKAARTTYNYPTTASNLTDAPTFTTRTDDWAGRTLPVGAAPVYTFSNPFSNVSKVTAPDGTVSETDTISNPGFWNDGLVSQVLLTNSSGSVTYAKTVNTWGSNSYSWNPRITQLDMTNDVGQTKKITFENYDAYNNVGTVREYGYDNAEIRHTSFSYWGTPFTTSRMLHLVSSSYVYDNLNNQIASTSYGYDSTPLSNINDPTNFVMHDPTYGTTLQSPPRGLLTNVTRYKNSTYGIQRTMNYDIAGNPTTEQVDCCQQKQITYSPSYKYGYPTQVTRGSSPTLQSSATYDLNTGVVRATTDENNQTTNYDYWLDTLRVFRVYRPDGGVTSFYYTDTLINDPDATHAHTQVNTITLIDATRALSTYQFFDGRGALTRDFGTNDNVTGYINTTDIEYDGMGRAFRQSNPYSAPSGGTTAINPTGLWTTRSFDALSRAYQVQLPDNTTVSTSFAMASAGYATTVTDQAGKQRRSITDALGRLARLDEPDLSGNLGADYAPNQPTSYSYDVLNDLTSVTQGSQTRTFKYDGLRRLIAQKLPEQQATLNDAGGSGSQWSSVFVYNDYGKLTDGYDARGVHTAISYDGLNRPLQVSYPNDPANTPTVTYTYDESRAGYYNAGRLTTLATALAGSTPATTQVYNYNQMGYVAGSQEIIGSASYSFSYAYNLLGELTAETYPTSRTVNYSYDRVAHLNTISDVSRTYDTIGVTDYDARGALKHETFGNGAERIITYGNNRMQPDSVKLWISGIEQEHIDYSYGTVNQTTGSVDTTQNTGQIGKVAIYVGGSNTKLAEQRFSYDSLGRLQTASEYDANGSQSYSITYTFDRYGNRFVAGGQTSAFSYVAVTGADIDATTNRFTTSANINYDYAGNITSDAKFTNLQYTLDANNRQRSARTLSSSPVMTSVYDGAGQRVQTTTSSTRNYVYDAFGALAAEYVNGSLDREYVYRGGEAMCIIEASGALKYLFTDLAGTPRMVMDGSAAIVSRHDYAPFGEDLLAGVSGRTTGQGFNQPDNVRQTYSGMEKDAATSLSHTQWRKYGNTQGRWTSVDPYGGSASVSDPQSMNRYSYVQNDPVNFTDPSGLDLQNPYYIPPSQNGWNSPLQLTLNWLNYAARQVTLDYWSSGEDHQFLFDGFAKITFSDDCRRFAEIVAQIATQNPPRRGEFYDASGFRDALYERFNNRERQGFQYSEFRSTGFKDEFRDEVGPANSPNQVYHYVGAFRAGFAVGRDGGGAVMENHENEYVIVPGASMYSLPMVIKLPDTPSHRADKALNQVAVRHGAAVYGGFIKPSELSDRIIKEVCK